MTALLPSTTLGHWPLPTSPTAGLGHDLPYLSSLSDIFATDFEEAPPPPQFIEPQQLEKSEEPTIKSSPSRSRSSSILASASPSSSSSSTTWPTKLPFQPSNFFLLPFPSIDEDTSFRASHAYHPRASPMKSRQTNNRVVPRSAKHARNLELNRKAATKCRTRQKAFVDNLQKRCKTEEEKMKTQTAEVRRLREEVLALRGEVMKRTYAMGSNFSS